MNLPLLDLAEVQAPLPEVIEDQLTVSDDVVIVAFNRRGNLLAGGCQNGTVVIWDFDTHGVARSLEGHEGCVTAVSWSRSSRRLLTSSQEGTLYMWDVLNATPLQSVHLGGERGGQAFLINLESPAEPPVPLLALGGDSTAELAGNNEPTSNVTFACFASEGSLTMVGTSRGTVHVVRTQTQEVVTMLRMPGGAAIKSLVTSRDGKSLLANSADRIIRAFSLDRLLADERQPPRELQDVVNRVQWAHASFSSESEHVVGTANSATDHLVYIWDMHGHLKHILGQGEKVKDGALHFACHPTRPILAVCSRSGSVYVWTKKYSENWSAFAPDFKELEENEEYAEREDEFDIKPTSELQNPDDDVEEAIDVLSVERTELDHTADADGARTRDQTLTAACS